MPQDRLSLLARRQPWLSLFLKFIDKLRIDSKEMRAEDERGSRLILWQSQRMALEQMAEGFSKDQRMVYLLKGRQEGISTITLALLLFWVAVHPRTIAALVCNNEGVRDSFRDTLNRYMRSFPPDFFGAGFAKDKHNSQHFIFTNGSRIDYLVAGLRKTSWGESRGYSACLCTEVADYGTDAGLKSFMEALAQENEERLFLFESPLALNTPLPTPDGWTTMGEVKEGDWLFNEDGTACRVIGTSPVFINRKCYRIDFSNGDHIIADANHTWRIVERRYYTNQQWRIRDLPTFGLDPEKHFVDVCKPLDLPDAELPIDPYLLGAWLGDGATAEPRITAGDEDIDEMRALLAARGCRLGVVTKSKDRAGMFHVLGVRATFIKMGLLGNKHIPAQYLRASRKQRLALLAGLMDTDGSIDKTTLHCTFASTNMALIKQVGELLSGLGVKYVESLNAAAGKVRMFPRGYTSVCRESRRLLFAELPDRPVFHLSRKRAIHEVRTRRPTWRKSKRLKIVAVTEVPSVPVRCVAVDTPSHLFLAGKTMIPTHNTAKGPNHWQEMWYAAEEELSICRIFLGWWAKEGNAVSKHHANYRKFGIHAPNGEEHRLCTEVMERFGHVVTMEQLAWYRWRMSLSDRQTMEQNNPWLPEEAFVMSGYSFFQMRLLQQHYELLFPPNPPNYFKAYRVEMGNSFWAMKLEQITDPSRSDEVELKIWEDPIREAQYVIGCDPAFGHSEDSDNHCISVWRCYADKLVQVAEYADNRFETAHCAWILAGLAGAYQNCMVNLELYGPGRVVMNEFDNIRMQLRQEMFNPMNRENRWDDEFMAGARWFLYRRIDNPGPGFVYNFECLALDTPLPTPSGWTTMGEVREGDQLISDDGRPTTVVGVSEIKYEARCYEIVFDDGTVIVADENHWWKVARVHWKNGADKLRRTSELRAGKYYIRKAEALDLPNVELPLDPYILGAWLGDGSSAAAALFCGDQDVEEMVSNIESCGQPTTRRRYRTCWHVGMTDPNAKGRVRRALIALGVLNNKHIPDVYLRASLDQRLSLLQGLMDTDGHSGGNGGGQCSFVTTSKPIAAGFSELVRSLGFKAKFLVHDESGHKGVECAPRLQFWFTAYPEMPVFRLNRKVEKLSNGSRKGYRKPCHRIVSIKEVKSVPVRCVMVDSPTSMYLAGAGMIPTHNTNQKRKFELFNMFRDAFTGDQLVIKSVKMLEEMAKMVQEKSDIAPQSPGRQHDDRPFAAALAVYAWNAPWGLRQPLIAAGATYERIMAEAAGRNTVAERMMDRLVYSYFARRTAEEDDDVEADPWANESWYEQRGLM